MDAEYYINLTEMQKTLHEFAKTIFDYYAALIESGFSKEQALVFAIQWQNTIAGNSISSQKDK